MLMSTHALGANPDRYIYNLRLMLVVVDVKVSFLRNCPLRAVCRCKFKLVAVHWWCAEFMFAVHRVLCTVHSKDRDPLSRHLTSTVPCTMVRFSSFKPVF